MGVPTSEVSYTSAMPRREDHEVHKDMWGHWTKKQLFLSFNLGILHLEPNKIWMLLKNVLLVHSFGICLVLYPLQSYIHIIYFVHIRIVHLNIIKVLFIH